MSAVQDVYDYLLDYGIAGGVTGWDLVRRRLTDTPVGDQVVVISEDGGPPPEIPSASGLGDSAMKDVGVQVMVRAAAWDGDASAQKAEEVYNALHGQRAVLLGSTEYMRVAARTGEPIFIGFDEQGRPRHTISFLMLTNA